MLGDVGGRLEAVAPRRSLFGPDYLRLSVLAVVSVSVHVWLLTHTAVPARDSLGFARYALCLQSPHAATVPNDLHRNWIDVVRAAEQPPGYPAAVCLTAKVVRRATDLPLPDSTLLATQIASAVAALLLVVPTYLIGRMLSGRFVGFATALLLQVLPVPARLTSDGLTEGLYLLAVAVAVMLAVRAVRRPGVGGFLLCGLATGASYLVRPEGLMVAAATGVVGVWLGATRKWPRDVALGRLTALTVGVALVAVPYMLLIGKISAKPTPQLILNPGTTPRDAIWKGQPGTSCAPRPTGGPVLAEWWHGESDTLSARVRWAVKAVGKETGKALNYLTALFALLGIVVHRRRIAAEPALWLLAVLALTNLALLMYLATRIGYVSERHTVLLVLLGCFSAASALGPVAMWLAGRPRMGWLWAGRFAPAGLLLLLVAAALPGTFKPLHANREGHKHAGRWLAEHVASDDGIVDPFCWAEWYTGRSLYLVPTDPPAPPAVYTVLEGDDDNPHSRLPRLQLAKDVAASGTLVYWWPAGPPERAEVRVYKTVR